MKADDVDLEVAIAAAVAAVRATITPSARKTGRNPRWPYVPVLKYTLADGSRSRSEQIRHEAYATRDEAIIRARRRIDAQMSILAGKLREPHYRALRASHGLPREIPTLNNPDAAHSDVATRKEATSA